MSQSNGYCQNNVSAVEIKNSGSQIKYAGQYNGNSNIVVQQYYAPRVTAKNPISQLSTAPN